MNTPASPPVALLRCALAAAAAAGGASAEAVDRRLAVVPDVHGDLEALRGALHLAGVTLGSGRGPSSLPENTTVVSLGDLVDRGPDGPACYAQLADLAEAARRAGDPARVVRLLGNHEWLNLLGVDKFDHPDTRAVQEDLLAAYVHAKELQVLGGWEGRLSAFGHRGAIGRVIAEEFELLALLPRPWHDPTQTGGAPGLPPPDAAATLFLHGGISLATARRYTAASELAAEAKAQLREWASHGELEALLPGPGGTELFDEVLQDRTLAAGPAKRVCPELEAVLAHFGAARLVLGHTPQVGGSRWDLRAQPRRAGIHCGGRLVLLDVAMSRWLLSMRRPEAAPRPVLLEVRYRLAAKAGEYDMLKGLRVLYGRPGGQPPEEELISTGIADHADL